MRIVRSYPVAVAGVTLAVALSVSAMTANAASTFLLQFGQHDTETAARQQWETLQNSHPDLLGNLSLRVAPVTTASGSETYRTQASGVASRDEAQSACNRLSAANVTCMVVETSMYLPQKQAASDIEIEKVAAAPEPVALAQVAPAAAPAPKERTFRSTFLPWLDDDSAAETETVDVTDAAGTRVEAAPAQPVAVAPVAPAAPAPRPERVEPPVQPQAVERAAAEEMSAKLAPGETRVVESRAPRSLNAQAPAPQAAPAPQPQLEPQLPVEESFGTAQVEVAEAIQVPLSFGNAVPVPANKPVGYGGYPSQPVAQRTAWVQLSHFGSKEAAMGYWRELSAQNPELMRLLRVRIVSPWDNRYGQSKTSLRMGPFRDQAEVDQLCKAAAQRELRCSMVQEVGNSATVAAGRRSSDSMEAYNRRQAVGRSYNRTPGAQPSGMYWVQLGAFDSVQAAQQRWSQLTTVHSDMLGRMQPQISYPALSSSPTPVYHLRTGPFVDSGAAASLCNRLQSRHLGCVVVQAR